MKLTSLLESLSSTERDFIAGLDYGQDHELHRRELDRVINRQGVVDFARQGYWHPYEVIELGKNWLQAGHEREYAACMGIVLKNIMIGADKTNDIDYIVSTYSQSVSELPSDLRAMLEEMIEELVKRCEPGGAPDAAAPRR